jgi:hypothetical protein
MKRIVAPILAMATLVLISSTVAVAAETESDGYRLVWADEFENEGKPDPKNCTFEQGFVRNNEEQWYQPENAFCENGKLIIEARREDRKPNPIYTPQGRDWRRKREFIAYTSACLITKGLHSWQYGRFEVKARIQTRDGLWPAIWFLGLTGGWPNCGEIDLMEYYRGMILANACWGSEQRDVASGTTAASPSSRLKTRNGRRNFMSGGWTGIARDRTARGWHLLNTIDITQTVNPAGRGPENPFRKPHYLLLNLAIGGTNGGDPSAPLSPPV